MILARAARRTGPAALACLVLVSGCARWSDLSFRVDTRLHFLAPKDRALVTLPLHLRWTMRDFNIVAPSSEAASRKAGYFAVFIDRPPIKPRETVRVIAHGDRACTTNPACPDVSYLADRGVYTTAEEGVAIAKVMPLGGNDLVQLHLAYVVLLDADGHRIGETAYRIEFKIRRGAIAT